MESFEQEKDTLQITFFKDPSAWGASTAAKIDAAVSKLGTGAGYDMTSKEKKESNRKLVFKVEF